MRPETQAALRIDDTYLRIVCEVLDEHDIDSRRVLAQAGLPRRLPGSGMTTSAETSIAFRRAFAAATDRRRELWPIVAGRLVLQATNPYGPATRTAPDVETIVRILERGDLYLTLTSVVPLRDAHERLVGIEFDLSNTPPDLMELDEIIVVTAHIRVWDSIWAGLFPYRGMELPVSLPLEAINRRDHVGVVRTSSRPRLHWYPEISIRRLPGANEYLHRQHVHNLEAMIDELRQSKNVRDRVVDRLCATGGVSCSVRDVAADLGTSARSLQRALEAQGLSFRTLRDSVRRELATSRLRDTAKPIAEIASDLGYASPTSFSDAFRTWFGQSPSAYRSGVERPQLGG
ncbi:helix-turn-helix transcriptional regulator [Salinibacterium sp. ZJ450]|uniref:helix-turn-helix transcriptional regulator n=1 Tax=Salinibacterium sp. ZJ450 TaxID=2708338 RepID=UPI0014204B0F|nr:helix-turn-helix transcriptional regulator [Salinibacterium sp. ZJ450]